MVCWLPWNSFIFVFQAGGDLPKRNVKRKVGEDNNNNNNNNKTTAAAAAAGSSSSNNNSNNMFASFWLTDALQIVPLSKSQNGFKHSPLKGASWDTLGMFFEEVLNLYPKTTPWCHERHVVFANQIFHHSILRFPKASGEAIFEGLMIDAFFLMVQVGRVLQFLGIYQIYQGFRQKLSWLSCGWTSPPIKEVLFLF